MMSENTSRQHGASCTCPPCMERSDRAEAEASRHCVHEDAVKWNPYNRVVQCHRCGQVFVPGPTPTVTPPPPDIWRNIITKRDGDNAYVNGDKAVQAPVTYEPHTRWAHKPPTCAACGASMRTPRAEDTADGWTYGPFGWRHGCRSKGETTR